MSRSKLTPDRVMEGPKVIVLHTDDQVFAFTDATGTEWHWNAGAGMRLVEASGRQPLTFFPGDHGLTIPYLQRQYPDLDLEYAKTTDLTRPILFVPFEDGTSVLIDGWHRVARAVMDGIAFLLCYELTEAERDQVIVMKIPSRPKLAPMNIKKGRRKP